MRNVLLILAFFSFSTAAFTQDQCGQAWFSNQFRAEHPELVQQIETNEQALYEQAEQIDASRAEKRIIPVVFTILHDNGPENITDDQVLDAIRIMNEDFNASNPELDDVISAFQGIIGDGDIELRLATKDPNGNPTTGIQRVESSQTYIGDNGSKINGWPRSKYLNIWVTDVITVTGASASAFAILPADAHSQPGFDGIIANHRYVGSIGTAISDGKTLSHEAGHYLGLRHTWGPTNFAGCDGTATNPNDPCYGVNNCNWDDGISDTPNTTGVYGGCNTAKTSCGSLDNIQNFMDYANCEAMFTQGQINVMRAALNSSIAERNKLWTSSNLAATGTSELLVADYHVDRPTACRGEAVTFYDASRYDAESWSWEITGPETFTSEEQNPTFTFGTAGYYSVKLTVTQGSTTEEIEEIDAFFVTDVYGNATPLKEDFETPLAGWVTVNRGLEDDKYKWDYSTVAGYDDNFSYLVYNVGNEDHKNPDELILNSVDFRPMQKADVSFKVAHARLTSTSDDRMRFSVSKDCGESWINVWQGSSVQLSGGKIAGASVYKPSSQSDWESFTVTNVPLGWLGPNALIKFTFEPGGGNQLFLDNINIDGDFSVIPFLVYPINGADQMSNGVALDWRAVPGASSYEYQLSTNLGFSSVVASGTNTVVDDEDSGNDDTQFKTVDLTNGQQYFWRVRANLNGVNSEWSEIWSFTVANDGVGISELDRNDMFIYPNPAQERLYLRLPDEVSQLDVEVYSIEGRHIRTEHISSYQPSNELSFNVKDLANGVYMLRARGMNMEWNQRFIINR